MTAVFRHEVKNYFHSLTAYVFGAFLLLAVGLGAMLYNIQAAVSNFEFALASYSLILAIIVPILTMRVIAEERRQKTDQLLYALPITTTQVIAGKYLALLTVYLVPLCIIALYPLLFAQFGEVYLLTSYGSIIAFFLLGAALLALGVFISSLTDNQGFAAGIGVAVILLNYYSVSLSEYVSTTATSSVLALCVLILALWFLIRHLTKNENLAYGICLALGAAVTALCGPLQNGMPENLCSLLTDHGVEPHEGIVVEGSREHYAFQAPYVLLPELGSHAITDPLLEGNYYIIMPLSLGLTVENAQSGSVTALLTTSDFSFSKAAGYNLATYEKEDGDTDGPFAVAVSIDTAGAGRIVWFASSDFLEDLYNAYSSGANTSLAMNALSSLIGEREAMAIRTKSLNYNYLTISASTASLLKLLMIGVFPLAYLGTGVCVVLKRRRLQHETV